MLLPNSVKRFLNSRYVIAVATTLIAGVAFACGAPVTIHMNDQFPPTFSFSGSHFAEYKRADFFIVSEVAPEDVNVPAYSPRHVDKKPVWWIWPTNSADGELERLPAITYGTVPSGWRQTVPETGAPPPLVEGHVYDAGGPQVSVPWAVLRFTIRNGTAVRLPLYQDEFARGKPAE